MKKAGSFLKRILSVGLASSIMLLSSCAGTGTQLLDFIDPDAEKNQIEEIAQEAYSNMIKNYWCETDTYSYLQNPYKPYRTDTFSDILWVYVQGLLGFETYYAAVNDLIDFEQK